MESFSQPGLLDAAAPAAPSTALEANGLQWTPKVIAAVIGCVLAESWNEKHLRRPSV